MSHFQPVNEYFCIYCYKFLKFEYVDSLLNIEPCSNHPDSAYQAILVFSEDEYNKIQDLKNAVE